MNYLLHIGVMLAIYGMLACSANLLIGFSGLLTMAHAAFYGLGAYVYALLSVNLGWPFWATLPCAVAFSALVGWVFSMLTLKFRNETFVLATIGFQMIVYLVLYNCNGLTHGPYGISGIPRPSLFGLAVESTKGYFAFCGIAFAVIYVLMLLIGRSMFALSLKALRDNEAAAQTLGISPRRQYIRAMIVSSALAAVPGVCFAGYVTYIDPTSFNLTESIFIASILLVGGSGNNKGPLCGVLFMLVLPEILRFVGMPTSIAANMREIIYGVVLVVLMYFRPHGFAGEYTVK